MKCKLILAALCLICAFLLIGCGTKTTPSTGTITSAEASPKPEVTAVPEESTAPVATLPDAGLKEDTEPNDEGSETTSQFDLAKSFVDKTLPELIEKIGEPVSSSYATSCLGPGLDGELVYDGFKVYTYKEGDKETIQAVLQDSSTDSN
jgi:hypothetical protein